MVVLQPEGRQFDPQSSQNKICMIQRILTLSDSDTEMSIERYRNIDFQVKMCPETPEG